MMVKLLPKIITTLYDDGGDDNSHNVDDEKGTSSAQFVIPN